MVVDSQPIRTIGRNVAPRRARGFGSTYLVRMKRTNLVLDEHLLDEAVRLGGELTYSRTVERALEEFVRRIRARQILTLAGSGAWEGDLAAMRGDRHAVKEPARRRRRGSR